MAVPTEPAQPAPAKVPEAPPQVWLALSAPIFGFGVLGEDLHVGHVTLNPTP